MSYEAIYDYTPQNQGDIALRVGDTIHRIKDVGCGWVIGNNTTTGETGHFPAEYVKSVTSWRKSFSKIRSVKKKDNDPEKKPDTNDAKINNQFKIKNNISLKQFETLEKINTFDDPQSVNSKSGPVKRWRKKLLKYSDGKNSRSKVLFGILAGVVLGTAIFLAMYYSFHYDILVASIITGVSTILLAIGLAISTRCRCIVLLVFPSLATGKGRATLLSIITGLLLMGPITNITNNSNQVAVSMACITELAYNQSQALQNTLQEPVRSLREQIKRGVNEVKKYGEQLDEAFNVLENGIEAAEKTISSALDKVKDFKNRCKSSVNSGFSKCQTDSRKIQADCMKALDPISMASKTVTDTVSKGVNSFVRGTLRVFGKKRRRRSCTRNTCPTLLRRSKRGALGKVCDIFTASDVICGGFKNLGVCNIFTLPGNLATGIFSGIRSVIDAYSNLFEVGVRNSGNIGSNANSSQSAAQIVDNIRAELTDKLDMATFWITILTRIMSTSVVLLIINAFLYDKRYNSKLSFDNLYITRYFKEIDGKRRSEHKKSILPLKKKERRMYTDSRSIKMSIAEKGKCKIGIAQVLLHSVITIMVIIFDYLLHFILYLLNKHGDVRLTFTGESNINIQITGSGLIAQLFKILVNDISIAQAYNSTIDVDVCLPQPTEPDQSQIYLFAFLYAVALFFVIMQGYGQRLLHKIAAYFYPEREQKRVNYLYRKMLVKRKTFILEAKQLILSNTVDDDQKSSSRLPKCFKKLPCCRDKSVQVCTNCEEVIENIIPCKNKDCQAVYCEECFTELGRNCPLCSGGHEHDIDDVMALDHNIEIKGNKISLT